VKSKVAASQLAFAVSGLAGRKNARQMVQQDHRAPGGSEKSAAPK
jgi:hypothetical protein